MIFDEYKLTTKILNRNFIRTRARVKKNIEDSFEDTDSIKKKVNQEYQKIADEINKVKGVWVVDDKGEKYETLNDYEKINLEFQVSEMIILKYNFGSL